MTARDVLSLYEALRDETRRMKEAALNEEWVRLVELEDRRRSMVVRLGETDQGISWGAEESRRKSELISETIALDADVQGKVQVHMQDLKQNMKGISNLVKLRQAYGSK